MLLLEYPHVIIQFLQNFCFYFYSAYGFLPFVSQKQYFIVIQSKIYDLLHVNHLLNVHSHVSVISALYV